MFVCLEVINLLGWDGGTNVGMETGVGGE